MNVCSGENNEREIQVSFSPESTLELDSFDCEVIYRCKSDLHNR